MSEEVKLINEFKSELINHLISRINIASEILDSVFTFDLLSSIILNLDYGAVKGKDYSFEVKIILISEMLDREIKKQLEEKMKNYVSLNDLQNLDLRKIASDFADKYYHKVYCC